MNPLTALLAERDRWTGASCTGMWVVFDPRGDQESKADYIERVQLAQAVCDLCPIFDKCRQAAANARPRDRAGTWAGVPYDLNGRPVRLKKES